MTNGEVITGERHVSVGLRFVAVLIDGIIFFILGYLIALITGQTTTGGFMLTGAPAFIWYILNIAYYILMEGYMGATIGKLVIGLKVQMEDGSPCTISASVIRNLLRIVDALPFIVPYLVGAIMVWSSPTRQRLGDRVAKTHVVKK